MSLGDCNSVANQDLLHARENTPSLHASVFHIQNTRTAVGASDLQLAHSTRHATERPRSAGTRRRIMSSEKDKVESSVASDGSPGMGIGGSLGEATCLSRMGVDLGNEVYYGERLKLSGFNAR
jgi:hypothetical protein